MAYSRAAFGLEGDKGNEAGVISVAVVAHIALALWKSEVAAITAAGVLALLGLAGDVGFEARLVQRAADAARVRPEPAEVVVAGVFRAGDHGGAEGALVE